MDEPISTPKLPAPIFKKVTDVSNAEALFSSSPGFGTPAYPIQPRRPQPTIRPFTVQPAVNTVQQILPILLPPQTLRPVAFRTLTKKHNLTIASSGLAALSQFIGKFCGSGWREDGLAERLLDEIAKQWKRDSGPVILDDNADNKLKTILKGFESCMSGGRLDVEKLSRSNSAADTNIHARSDGDRPDLSRDDSQQSLGLSSLEVEDRFEEDEESLSKQDARSYMKIISALDQPRLVYSTTKKTLEVVTRDGSLLPPIQNKIAMFKNKYHLVHQRLLRNESFQTPSFATVMGGPSLLSSASNAVSMRQAYKITPISNLLGRSGTSHLLLGLLVHNAAGDLALSDLTNSVVLDISIARPIPEDGAWFCPGMIVLVEGTYEEDGSNISTLGTASGIGGQIKGRFIADTVAGPPAERREVSLGTNHDLKSEKIQTTGAGFGWVDILGVGSERATGSRMRRIQKRLLAEPDEESPRSVRSKVVIFGECNLDNPRTFEAIRATLGQYTASGVIAEQPLAVIFLGNFVSGASMTGSIKGGNSVEYKERFDTLASVLSEFPTLLSSTSFVFVPGDNDPWASSFTAGAASILPRQSVPDLFTSRVRRAVNNANSEALKKENSVAGETIWTSNPARISLFGPVDEIVLFRDDITGRLRRNAVMFSKPPSDENDDPNENPADSIDPESRPGELDRMVHEATSHVPDAIRRIGPAASTTTARKLVKTILDQGHLSPFPISSRPVLWDFASALNLYPLPTALVLADAEAPAFTLTYEGCHVMNPGRLLDDLGARKGMAKYVEYDVRTGRGIVKDMRF